MKLISKEMELIQMIKIIKDSSVPRSSIGSNLLLVNSDKEGSWRNLFPVNFTFAGERKCYI